VSLERFLERSNRITEVPLTPELLGVAHLLIPFLRSCFISGTSLPVVVGRPCGFPSVRLDRFLLSPGPAKYPVRISANTASMPARARPLGVMPTSSAVNS
jgi:hypothetical protein